MGLAVVVTPFAAIAAFLDFGEDEDTNCTPVLSAASGQEVEAADKWGRGECRTSGFFWEGLC